MSEWHYTSVGQQHGPVSAKQLKMLAAGGELKADDMVWNESLPDWVPAAKLRGLVFSGGQAAVQPAPAPEPLPEPEPAAALPAHPVPEPAPEYAQQEEAPAEAASPLPYASPTMPGGPVTPGAIETLRQTKPWVRIIAIFMLIYAGILVLIALLGAVMAVVGTANARARGGGAIFAGIVFAFCMMIAAAVVFFFPALFLIQYASRIGKLQQSGGSNDLEAALKAQKSYFLFMGILCLLGAAFGIVSLLGRLMT